MLDRDAIQQALYALADQNDGRLTPENVVEAAREPVSPLHPHFTWDNDRAAHLRRLDEARTIIRTVKVTITTTQFQISAPAFVRDPTASPRQGYTTLGRLRSNEDAARELVVQEFARASTALARAKAVAIALDLGQQIEEIEARLIVLSERVREVGAAVPH